MNDDKPFDEKDMIDDYEFWEIVKEKIIEQGL